MNSGRDSVRPARRRINTQNRAERFRQPEFAWRVEQDAAERTVESHEPPVE